MRVWDHPNAVPDAEQFLLLGTYYGYPHCCAIAFLGRMGLGDYSNSIYPGEGFQLQGTGYVPCRHCERLSKEDQIAAINRHRLHPVPFSVEDCLKDDVDDQLLNRLILSGELFRVYVQTVRETLPVHSLESELGAAQTLWLWSAYQLDLIKTLFNKIDEIEKDKRPAEQQRELRMRCVEIGKLRYELVRKHGWKVQC